MRKDRTHIIVDGNLKQAASEYALSVGMDFSELVRDLLRKELQSPTIWPAKKQAPQSNLNLISGAGTVTSSGEKPKKKRASTG